MHAFLNHLQDVGFDGAPQALGTDELGREILTFAEGQVVWPDHFSILDQTHQLERVAMLIRDFHDASASFVPPPDAIWQILVPAEGNDLIVHNDLAPWNLVVGDRWTFIDWDCVCPGSRLWDVAYALHGFVPLSATTTLPTDSMRQRMRAFVDAYGLDEEQRCLLVPMLSRRTQSMSDFLLSQSTLGIEPWRGLVTDGHADIWLSDTEFIEERESQWLDALLG